MTSAVTADKPLWLSIEEKIAELGSGDFDDSAKEATVHKIATALDGEGFNVSRHAANLLMLRKAVDARQSVGRPLMNDFSAAAEALTLDDVTNPAQATISFVHRVGADFPDLEDIERRADLRNIVEGIRLDLLVVRANELGGDKGTRFLLENEVAEETILQRLSIDQAKLDEVKAAIAAELAEIKRVNALLAEVEGQDDAAKAKHLITKDVADENIIGIAGLTQEVIDTAKKLMEEEIKEKARLAAEAEAAKKAAAEGPKLEDIPADEMLEHIEAIREIMEFSDDPGEIAAMCEQSNLPKALIEIATTDADKLDELEAAAEG
ncbi:MAG: hypothetical protein V2I67_08175 [Thermoanaerobaculales bacterium]|jgi:hypothetical protein|nr:hypothetical protein [Thermoanaerobaculales bacterium]